MVERKTMEVLTVNGRNVEVTISEGRSKDLYNGIVDNSKKGIELYFDSCEKVLELRDSKGFYQLGFDSFKDMCADLFETGETQAKNMCLIAKSYGTTHTDGRVEIMNKEKLSVFTPTQLLLIRTLSGFTGNIETTCTAYGITPATTCAHLRDVIATEKAAIEDKKKSEGNGEGSNVTVAIKDDSKPQDNEPQDNEPQAKEMEDRFIKLSEVRKKLCVEGMEFYADLGSGLIHYTIEK